MKAFARFIGKFPFAGKLTIRPVVFWLYNSMTVAERRNSYAATIALLLIFAYLHWQQAEMGIETLSFEAPVWAKAVAAIYALVNISVVLTQLYLAGRATHFFFFGDFAKTRRRAAHFTDGEVLRMLGVTLGGQTLFSLINGLYS